MKSRDVIAESSELNDLKELRLVYPWWQAGAILIGRTIGRPAQWKADLHAFTLSLLPAVIAVHALLATPGAIGTTFWINMGLYAITFGTVVFFKGFSKAVVDDKEKEVVDDKTARNKVGISLIVLVSAAFLPVFTKEFGGSPTNEAVVTLIGAAIIAFISQKFLALDPDYLVEAKKSPPLVSDREKRVWKKAAAVYGILGVAALPRLLPENALNMPRQMIKLGIEAVRGEILCVMGALLAGGAILAGVILALFYWRFKLLKLFELLKRSWLFR